MMILAILALVTAATFFVLFMKYKQAADECGRALDEHASPQAHRSGGGVQSGMGGVRAGIQGTRSEARAAACGGAAGDGPTRS